MKANFRRNYDIKENDIFDYSEVLTRVLTKQHPDVQKRKKVSSAIAMCSFMDKNSVMLEDAVIDNKVESQDRFFSLLSHRNTAGDKFSFITMDMDVTFKLAPDLLVYKKTRSYFGGIYSDVNTVVEEKPRDVTEDEIKAIRAFNVALAMKLFTDSLNIPGQNIPAYPNF